MPGTSVRVLLARHGETEWNVEGRWQGHADSALTPRGLQQIDMLADALADEPVSAVYSSDLGRALRTAEAVAQRHGFAATVDPRLREIDTGLWTSHLASNLRHEYPDEMHAWRTKPASIRIPGGETIAEALRRSLDFLADVMPRHLGETVVVISHGTVVHAIIAAALGHPVTDLWIAEGGIDNCQISRAEWSRESGLRLVELADVRHLEEVGTLKGWRVLEHGDPAVEGRR